MEIGTRVRVVNVEGVEAYRGEVVEIHDRTGVRFVIVRDDALGEDHEVLGVYVEEEPEFKVGDRVEAFTSPGDWIAVEVYAVDGEWLEVGNGDPVYGPNDEIRESFRVNVGNVRRREP